jgi:hypothetical protein
MNRGPEKASESFSRLEQIGAAPARLGRAMIRVLSALGKHRVWLIALVIGVFALLLPSPTLFKSTPPSRSGPLTVAGMREKILRVGFSGCTEEERAFVRELYEHDLAALRDILAYRYRIALARNQLRTAREIQNAYQLVSNALAKLKADSDLDPTRFQALIDSVLAALQRQG